MIKANCFIGKILYRRMCIGNGVLREWVLSECVLGEWVLGKWELGKYIH